MTPHTSPTVVYRTREGVIVSEKNIVILFEKRKQLLFHWTVSSPQRLAVSFEAAYINSQSRLGKSLVLLTATTIT